MSVSGIFGPPLRLLAKSAIASSGILKNVVTQSSVRSFFIIVLNGYVYG
jgi:hypothetical protein